MSVDNIDKKEKIVLIIGLSLIAAVALITLFRVGSASKQNAPKLKTEKETHSYAEITAEELAKKINSEETVYLLDVRSESEYDNQHIINSVNIPLEELNPEKLKAVTNTPLVIIGSDSRQAEQAASLIKKLRSDLKISILYGGIKSWINNKQPTVNWGDPTSFLNQSKVTFISPEEAKKLLEEPNMVYFIDVRNPAKIVSRIPTAINIPSDMLEKKRNDMPLEKTIIVYGQDDIEGFSAGVVLHDIGILSAYVLKGGFNAWQENNFPMTR